MTKQQARVKALEKKVPRRPPSTASPKSPSPPRRWPTLETRRPEATPYASLVNLSLSHRRLIPPNKLDIASIRSGLV
jgi:hypothetical protein